MLRSCLWLILALLTSIAGCASGRKDVQADPARARKLVAEAVKDLGARNPKEALEELDEAIRYDSNSAEAWYQRGNARMDGGDLRGAVEDYGRALFLSPTYAAAYFNRALAYAALGSYKNAARDLQEAVKLNPQDRDAFLLTGKLYDRYFDGERTRALAAYRRYLELGGADPDIVTRVEALEPSPPTSPVSGGE